MRALVTAFLLAFVVTGAQTQHLTTGAAKPAPSATDPAPSPAALIARAKALELNTPYVALPGDPLVHHAAGFAKVMCSAVFITGLDPDFAAENVGYFTAPYEMRAKLGKPVGKAEVLSLSNSAINGANEPSVVAVAIATAAGRRGRRTTRSTARDATNASCSTTATVSAQSGTTAAP